MRAQNRHVYTYVCMRSHTHTCTFTNIHTRGICTCIQHAQLNRWIYHLIYWYIAQLKSDTSIDAIFNALCYATVGCTDLNNMTCILYIANCLRRQSFVVVEINCNTLSQKAFTCIGIKYWKIDVRVLSQHLSKDGLEIFLSAEHKTLDTCNFLQYNNILLHLDDFGNA